MCQSCSKYGYFFLSPIQTNIPLEVFDQLCCCSIMIIGLVLRPCGFNNHKWLEVLLPVGAKKKKKRRGWCNSSFNQYLTRQFETAPSSFCPRLSSPPSRKPKGPRSCNTETLRRWLCSAWLG